MSKKEKGFWTPGRILASIIFGVIALGLLMTIVTVGRDVPVFSPSGMIAEQQKSLILFTVLLSAIVVVPVFAMLIIIATRYRENGGKGKYTPDEEDNHWFEALWWGIPILIIGVLGVVTWVSTHQLDPTKPLESNVKPLNVQVVALQWRWLFIYPDQKIASVNELIIPAKTPINFKITSDGPMSAFWVPALGTQVYAMSGMSMPLHLIADKAGTFRGSNSNISGVGYSDMNFKVVALEPKVFDVWAKGLNSGPAHQHLEWSSYEKLAKPTRDTSVDFYHLHDTDLYTKVIEKFMHGGHSTAQENEHTEGH